ncbi:hypothetical protein BJ508DRAFT_332251 [Ascobolus immersus RN42]|uniref:Uncharacterized protein n=1 Tax=Ascobolus immersus RN42 TaxID=1160509 RepID=A0A3N4HS21_ASCIM|nr:hypothetical protein BJ508DRAFT_332251 [Ascobolus immersus RN42]
MPSSENIITNCPGCGLSKDHILSQSLAEAISSGPHDCHARIKGITKGVWNEDTIQRVYDFVVCRATDDLFHCPIAVVDKEYEEFCRKKDAESYRKEYDEVRKSDSASQAFYQSSIQAPGSGAAEHKTESEFDTETLKEAPSRPWSPYKDSPSPPSHSVADSETYVEQKAPFKSTSDVEDELTQMTIDSAYVLLDQRFEPSAGPTILDHAKDVLEEALNSEPSIPTSVSALEKSPHPMKTLRNATQAAVIRTAMRAMDGSSGLGEEEAELRIGRLVSLHRAAAKALLAVAELKREDLEVVELQEELLN